jgi:hypothetical protein
VTNATARSTSIGSRATIAMPVSTARSDHRRRHELRVVRGSARAATPASRSARSSAIPPPGGLAEQRADVPRCGRIFETGERDAALVQRLGGGDAGRAGAGDRGGRVRAHRRHLT